MEERKIQKEEPAPKRISTRRWSKIERKNQPEKHIKFGGVRVTIWRDTRKGQDNRTYEGWSIVLDRAYKDAKGQWQNTHNLKENDVPKAIAALMRAFAYLTEKETQEMDGPAENEGPGRGV